MPIPIIAAVGRGLAAGASAIARGGIAVARGAAAAAGRAASAAGSAVSAGGRAAAAELRAAPGEIGQGLKGLGAAAKEVGGNIGGYAARIAPGATQAATNMASSAASGAANASRSASSAVQNAGQQATQSIQSLVQQAASSIQQAVASKFVGGGSGGSGGSGNNPPAGNAPSGGTGGGRGGGTGPRIPGITVTAGDVVRFGESVARAGLAIATFPQRLRNFGDAVLQARRDLGELHSGTNNSFAVLDAERLGRKARLAAGTAGGTSALARQQSRLEERLLPVQIAMSNIMSMILEKLMSGTDQVVTILTKTLEANPLTAGIAKDVKAAMESQARVERATAARESLAVQRQIQGIADRVGKRKSPPVGGAMPAFPGAGGTPKRTGFGV